MPVSPRSSTSVAVCSKTCAPTSLSQPLTRSSVAATADVSSHPRIDRNTRKASIVCRT